MIESFVKSKTNRSSTNQQDSICPYIPHYEFPPQYYQDRRLLMLRDSLPTFTTYPPSDASIAANSASSSSTLALSSSICAT
mmetsp:Transcript_15048/g.25645  ORF Transcript_15048/g.25645 Transcript_15048/m.25645 type:complete len:81 (+) Transcript_15048:146-388(+)